MAATSYTLTGDFADILGGDFVVGNAHKIRAWVVANSDTLSDPVGNVVRTGTQSITIAADGTFSVSLWATNDATLNPTAFQYKVFWKAIGEPTLKPISDDSGWFSLTADTNLADVIEEQYVPPTWLTTVTASLASYVTDAQTAETNAETAQAAAEAARDAAIDISGIATPDALVQDLVLNTGGAGPLTSAALSATFDSGDAKIVYCGPSGNDALNTGKLRSAPKKTLAGALAAIGSGVRGTVVLLAGVTDAGSGVDMTNYPVSILGPGSGIASIAASTTQTRPVLDLRSTTTSNRLTIGGFTITGDNTADATNTNKGLALNPTTSLVGAHFYDILTEKTGGSGFDFGCAELCTFNQLVAQQPVGAATNDIAWVRASGAFNGNTFYRLGLLGTSLAAANVGAGGAVRIKDSSYTPHDNKFVEPWAQTLLLASGATVFHFESNSCAVENLQTFDSAKDAGATGTSYIRFAAPATTNLGGNEVTGVIPGRDTAANAIEYGVDIQQSRNAVVGVKGYRGYNTLLASGVANTYVELTGSQGATTDPAVVDNSGVTSNIIIDHYQKTATWGAYLEDVISTSTQGGPRFRDTGSPANGAVYLGNTGARVQAVSTAVYTTADNVIFRNIAQTNAFAIATTTAGVIGCGFFNAGTLPAASSTYRGRLAMTQGASGVADRLVICRKDKADAYAWADVFNLTGSATLDFPSVAAAGSQELTITVSGAAVGDCVALGAPAAIEAGLVWNGYVSAADTVKVRVTNITAGAIDPTSATWKATVVR